MLLQPYPLPHTRLPTASFVGNLSRKISCGAAHTACVTASGQLFVWGCGDGGRLGLGEERLGHQFEPVLVEALASAGEKIGSVSCGNSHTLVRYFMHRVQFRSNVENGFESRGTVKPLASHSMLRPWDGNLEKASNRYFYYLQE